MISGPIPSPRMTVIFCVTELVLISVAAHYSGPTLPVDRSDRQKPVQRALLLQRIKVVKSTDMSISNKNLGPPYGDRCD